jgi:hypothetical protein
LGVVSTFLPGAGDSVWAFHTELLARSLLVAVVESCDRGVSVDESGHSTLVFLRAHQDANHRKSRTRFVNVSAGDSVGRLVRTILTETACHAEFLAGNAVVFYGACAITCRRMLIALGAPKATLPGGGLATRRVLVRDQSNHAVDRQ